MKAKLEFTRFDHQRNIDELLYEIFHFTTDLEFIKIELDFIKHLIKSYPFEKKVINLFERIQLFIQKIDTFHEDNKTILKNSQKHEVILNGMLECNDLSCDNFYVKEHENLAELVFNYKQEYTDFKSEVYEYILSIIK